MTEQSVTMTASEFASLVKPVLPFVDTSGVFQVLGAVRLEIRDGWLLAMTTDRFRAGVQRMRSDAPAFAATVSAADVRQILAIFKPGRGSVSSCLTLTVKEGKLRAEAEGGFGFSSAAIQFDLIDGDFPSLTSLFTAAIERAGKGAKASHLNHRFLSGFRDATSGSRTPIYVSTGGASAPAVLQCGDFIGIMMPMRLERSAAQPDLAGWLALLAAEPAKPARKRAAKTPVEAAS